MTPQPSLESVEEGLTRHMPIRLNPCLDPSARTLPFLASGAAFDPRHSLSVFCPETFEAQQGEPARHAGMNATESQDTGLLRCHLSCEFPQPLGSHLIEPFRITAEPKGAYQVIGVSASQGRASTRGFDHLFTPQVQRIM
jgi:hypothetical protein